MAYTENKGVQAPSVKVAEIDLADLTSAEALDIISLPAQAVVTGGHVYVSEAFNSTSSDALTIGDLDDADEYKTSMSVQATGLTALVPTGIACTTANQRTITLTWTSGGGTPTTGKLRVVLEYIDLSRSDFWQG